jgi:hypothetical protein
MTKLIRELSKGKEQGAWGKEQVSETLCPMPFALSDACARQPVARLAPEIFLRSLLQ